jgi:oligoendopeptidase F
MWETLPEGAEGMQDWSWEQLSPYFRELSGRALDEGSVAGFLADWTRLHDCVGQVDAQLRLGTRQNTADEEAERHFRTFLDEVYPRFQEAEQGLKTKLLESGLEPAGFGVPLLKMRTEASIFRQANLPLQSQESKLSLAYNKIMSTQTVEWEGEERTISQLRPFFQDADRARRERAWKLAAGRQLADRQAINDLWQQFVPLRLEMARNAGFGDDYRAYRWLQRLRFDYSPEDCYHYHDAIEEVAVPAARRIYERRRQRLGVDSLRPWDLDVDPLGRPPLRPFDDVETLIQGAGNIFHRVDHQLGAYYDTMVQEDLLDLPNRKNKAPGAFCTGFPALKRPFVFGNAVGLHGDVKTVLHELGHAFHVFEKAELPYHQQRQTGSEFNEVAAMAMEFLGAPYLTADFGGFYSEPEAARARVEHLESSLLFWPYMAVVDAFQHWVYENPAAATDPARCDGQWAELWHRFMQGVDWSGLDDEMVTGWQRKLHIHRYPFYYVEYGLALMGSVQIWGNALQDQAKAVASYRKALALGGTVPLPELYIAAGARLGFGSETLGPVVELMERTIAELDAA